MGLLAPSPPMPFPHQNDKGYLGSLPKKKTTPTTVFPLPFFHILDLLVPHSILPPHLTHNHLAGAQEKEPLPFSFRRRPTLPSVSRPRRESPSVPFLPTLSPYS